MGKRGAIKHSEETKKLMSERRMDRKNRLGYINSPETREKLRKVNIGRKHTQESKEKIREKLSGLKRSDEFKEKCRKNSTGKNNSMYGKRGKLAPNWKGGVTSESKIIRNCLKYRLWRTNIFERDNCTCQNNNCKFCGNKKGVELNVHHIKHFSKYKELRLNIDNGITYCKLYHFRGVH